MQRNPCPSAQTRGKKQLPNPCCNLDADDYYECSRDCVGEQWSSMYIPGNTRTTEAGENTLVKMTSFYDNEMGYSARMAELALFSTLFNEWYETMLSRHSLGNEQVHCSHYVWESYR